MLKLTTTSYLHLFNTLNFNIFVYKSRSNARGIQLVLCKPKILGGLGITNLETHNRRLLSKWLYKLLNEEGIWQNFLRKKKLETQVTITGF